MLDNTFCSVWCNLSGSEGNMPEKVWELLDKVEVYGYMIAELQNILGENV